MTEDSQNGALKGEARPKSFARRFGRFVVRLVIWVVGFFVFAFGGAWLWFESSSSDEVLSRRAETFLEDGLGRDVTIGDLSLRPGLPAKLVVKDVRLGNAEGTLRENQASLSRIDLRLSLRALLRGKVRISDVVLVDPVFVLEILPDGDGVRTNIPVWLGPKSESEEPPDLNVNRIEIRNGTFELIDQRNDLGVVAERIDGEVDPELQNLDDPRLSTDLVIGAVRFRASEIEFPPFYVEGRVRLAEKRLMVEKFRGEGKALRITAEGPISRDRMDLDATLHAELDELKGSLGLDVELSGSVDARGRVAGEYEDVGVEGTFESAEAQFDVYRVKGLTGAFRLLEDAFEVVAYNGSIAGGRVSARYAAQFREGEPRNVLEIRHEDVYVGELLAGWGIRDSGLLSRGDGELRLAWDDGSPEEGLTGQATLRPSPGQQTKAAVGFPMTGHVAYRVSEGNLHFESLRVATDVTSIVMDGTVGLSNDSLQLHANVESSSFSEVDRIWANLARAFGQEGWELLDIKGNGSIDAMVSGSTEAPMVDIEVHADGFSFDGLELERADGKVTFDGAREELVFHGARFEHGDGELVVRDRIGLGADELDLALTVQLTDWDVAEILDFLELDFPVDGSATGQVEVAGVPSAGRVRFSPLEIRKNGSSISLSGHTDWTPEEKGLSFNLDVGLNDVPLETVAGVLDLGSDLPVSGLTTGTVHLEGPLANVAGAGSVTVTRGALVGEPFDMIASDLVVSEGVFRLRNLDIRMQAGFIRGEAKVDFAQDRFGYVIDSSEIEIARLQGYPRLRNVLTGKLVVLSSGAGTIRDPEIVLDARVVDAVLLEVPVADPGIRLYGTVRNGEYTLRGGVGDTLAIEGEGRLDIETSAISGDVSVAIQKVASIMRRFEKRTGVKVRGSASMDVSVDGSFAPINELVVDGRIDKLDFQVDEYSVRTARPARFSLIDADFVLDTFDLLVNDQAFKARGRVSLDDGALELDADGLVGAGLLAVAMPDLRANGDVAISLDIDGTIDDRLVQGTAEIRNADFRIQGFPQAFRNVNSTLVMAGSLIEIDSFTARLGGGSVSAGGRLELGGASPRIRINVQGRDVDLRLSQGLMVEGDFDLVLAGDPADRLFLRGESKLTKVLYTRDIEIGAAIVDFIVARRAKIESISDEWEARVALDVEVDADDAISVRNILARVTGSAGVRIAGTLAQPVMLGRAVFDEGGLIRINSVEYRLVNGSINFQNPFRIDPYVDLTAEGRYSNEYDLTIVLTGTPDALQMSVASDPPIADLSILNVFGIPTENVSGSVSARDSLSSAGGSIIDSSVGSLIGSRLTFADNLRLEGLTGPEPKVTIEKSISDDVRAIVTYTMNDAGDNVEVIEWRVSPRFLIQATRDSTKDTTYFINAIDVSFSRRFGGQW
jgi:autotransporter translocation and assembly factor TamB